MENMVGPLLVRTKVDEAERNKQRWKEKSHKQEYSHRTLAAGAGGDVDETAKVKEERSAKSQRHKVLVAKRSIASSEAQPRRVERQETRGACDERQRDDAGRNQKLALVEKHVAASLGLKGSDAMNRVGESLPPTPNQASRLHRWHPIPTLPTADSRRIHPSSGLFVHPLAIRSRARSVGRTHRRMN